MTHNPVSWFEIYVSDIARAKKFYEMVFAVNLSPLGDPNDSNIRMMAFPSDMGNYGVSGALVEVAGFPVGGNSTLVYFWSDDCAVELSRVVAAGGSIQKPKMAIGEYGFIALAVDTEGNMFGIHSMS